MQLCFTHTSQIFTGNFLLILEKSWSLWSKNKSFSIATSTIKQSIVLFPVAPFCLSLKYIFAASA